MTSTNDRPTTGAPGWRVAGIAATVVVIGVGISVGPVLAGNLMQKLDTTTKQSAETFDRVPTAASVDAATADVTLAAAAADQIAVQRTVEWAKREPTIAETWSSGAFDVDLGCPDGITGWLNDYCRIDYVMQLPKRTPVDVSVTTGDVTLDGALGDSDVTATTGDVTLDGAGGDSTTRTTTGSIIGRGLASASTSAEAETGSIELDYTNTPEQVTASVTTGDISITVPDDGVAYRVVGETQTGERDIQVPTDPAADRVIDVTSTTGDVEIGYRK